MNLLPVRYTLYCQLVLNRIWTICTTQPGGRTPIIFDAPMLIIELCFQDKHLHVTWPLPKVLDEQLL